MTSVSCGVASFGSGAQGHPPRASARPKTRQQRTVVWAQAKKATRADKAQLASGSAGQPPAVGALAGHAALAVCLPPLAEALTENPFQG
jgi:hypothetical protein